MISSPRVRRGACLFAYSLLIALAVLFFCSKSSPGYPINDWCDANIYFTIGKGMTRGQVVYRDLYDHKGPLLYALHALCALVSFRDFTGVYLMEALLAAAFLCGVYPAAFALRRKARRVAGAAGNGSADLFLLQLLRGRQRRRAVPAAADLVRVHRAGLFPFRQAAHE